MNAHVTPPANVLRFPPRLRVVPKWEKTTSALDALLSAGTIDGRQHAAGLAYAAVRRRYEDVAASYSARRIHLTEAERDAVKRKHGALLITVGADRFVLDRLCLDGDAPLRCEVERVRAALGRVAGATT